MKPAEVTARLADTFDAAIYVAGFLAVFAFLGWWLGYRQAMRWRFPKRDRWYRLYR